uniref:Uncharacterized protein n=1 Tax=viral metagenome TaxID=1070528 RepID=A0A6C0DLS4_9ZZZZ
MLSIEEILKRDRDQAAAKKAQLDAAFAAAIKAQQDAADAAAIKAQQDAGFGAAIKAQQDAAAAAVEKILKNIQQSGSIATLGNEIQKQKQQVEENLKLLTSAAIAGSGLLAGGLTTLAKSSNDMNNNQTFSKENRTSVKNMYVIMPDINTNKKYIKNPDYKNFVKDYGTQIVPYKFYNKDSQLREYEKFFNDNKTAFVPMAIAIDYFSQIQNDNE